jgi:hypothetical protein
MYSTFIRAGIRLQRLDWSDATTVSATVIAGAFLDRVCVVKFDFVAADNSAGGPYRTDSPGSTPAVACGGQQQLYNAMVVA